MPLRPFAVVSWWPWLVGIVAALAIATGVRQLERAADGVAIETLRLGTTPVTVFRPAAVPRDAPVVLVAHGFAGSQQLMQPLARNGHVAITFDFPGHGRNATPMRGGLTDQDESLRTLLASMEEMGVFARGLAGADGRYAVLGHSMASDIVVRHAQAHAEVQATVGVSLFAPSIDAQTAGDSPRNLLVIAGALEPQMMASEALRVVGRVAGPNAVAETTYGRFEDGTARRATLSPGVEHIGVLYSAHTLAESLTWLDAAAFARPPTPQPFIDARGPAIGLLLVGVVALARAGARDAAAGADHAARAVEAAERLPAVAAGRLPGAALRPVRAADARGPVARGMAAAAHRRGSRPCACRSSR